ncbi:MAG: hypothetical protein ACC647_02130 [Anaerolineales bacterium]
MKQTLIGFITGRSGRLAGMGMAVLFAAAFIAGPAAGQGLQVASSVQAGEVVDNDLLLTGFEGVIDGTVIGNVFATGKEVTVNGEVQGSLFVIGDKVTVNGDVGGGTYVVGVSLEQGSSSVINLNLYFLGINLRTDSGAVIGRDLVMVALSANLAGEVERDTRAVVGLLEFLRLIGEGLSQGVRGQPIVHLAPAVAATGKTSLALARPNLFPDSLLTRGSAPQAISSDEVVEIVLDYTRGLVAFLIVGGLALWLLPNMFNGATAQLGRRPWASAGYGALVFVNGFLLTLLLAAVFLGVGVALRALTLTALAWAFWGVAFSGLGLAFSLFMVSFVWLSKAIVATLIGVIILQRVYPRALEYRSSALVLGLLIYLLLFLIPVIGWVVALIVTVLGLGALFLSIRELKWSRKRAAKKK